MANRVREYLLRITGDPADAKDALHEVAREVSAFGQLHAEATVDVNTKPAETALAKAKHDLQEFGRLSETAKVELQTKGAEAQLARLQTRLANLSKQDASPKVDIQVAKTVAQIERLEAKLLVLGHRKVNIDVDVNRGAFERIGDGIARALSGALGALGDAGKGVAGIFGKLSGALSTLGPLLRGAAIVIGVLLAPALLALAASAVAAAAGLGLLVTAFAAALGPAVLVVIAVMARFAKVLEAVKENETKVAAEAQKVKDATQAQKTAQEGLRRAQETASQAAVDGYRAQSQAAEDLSDSIRGVSQAELTRDQANLNYKKAVQNLKDLRHESGTTSSSLDGLFKKFTDVSFRPKDLIEDIRKSGIGKAAGGGAKALDIAQGVLDVRQADLDRTDAEDGVTDAITKRGEAEQKVTEFAKEGLQAYEPYKSALQGVEDAQNSLRDSTEKLTTARTDHNKALKELDPREKSLARTLGQVKDALTKAFAPATDRVFGAVITALKDVTDFAKDGRVQGGLRTVGGAIAGMITSLSSLLRREGARKGFRELADAAAHLIRQLGGRAFKDFLIIVGRLVQATLPRMLDYVDKIADKFSEWRKGTDRAKRVKDIVDSVLESFERWRKFVGAIGRFIASVFGTAKKQGDDLLGSLTKKLDEWADWMRKHPEEVKQFFKDAANLARHLGRDLEKVVGWLDKIVGAADKAVTAIGKVAAGFGKGNEKGQTPESIGSDLKQAQKLRALANRPGTSDARKKYLRGLADEIVVQYRAAGGPIYGAGSGDTVPVMAEPGEFMLRKSVAQAIGLPRLNQLNTTGDFAGSGSGGISIQEQTIVLPPAPGHDQLGDPRHQAALLARELRRRGIASVGGGGFGA